MILSYHSLEDRLVKHAFQRWARERVLQIMTKKPIQPQPEEVQANPRARSAKLRAAERMAPAETAAPSVWL